MYLGIRRSGHDVFGKMLMRAKQKGIVGDGDVSRHVRPGIYWLLPAFSPSCPGNTRMEITSPVFDKVEFNLDSEIFIKGKYLQLLLTTTTQIIYIYKKLC